MEGIPRVPIPVADDSIDIGIPPVVWEDLSSVEGINAS